MIRTSGAIFWQNEPLGFLILANIMFRRDTTSKAGPICGKGLPSAWAKPET